jgi:hypothetical protein
MRARLEQVRSTVNAGEAQTYIQIAVFDHMFVKRPVRSPVATLAWKNWRGDPVLAFPGFATKAPEPTASAPAGASTRPPSWSSPSEAPPKIPSLVPAPVVAIGSSAAAPPLVTTSSGGVAPVPRPGASVATSPEPIRPSVIPAPVVSVGMRSQSPPDPGSPSPPIEEEIPVPLVPKHADVLTADDVEVAIDVPPPSGPAIDVEVSPASEPLIDVEVASSPGIDVELGPPSGPLIDVAVSSIPVSELPSSAVPAAPPVPAAKPPLELKPSLPAASAVLPANSTPAVSAAPAANAPTAKLAPVANAPGANAAPAAGGVTAGSTTSRISSVPPAAKSYPPSGAPRRRAPGEDLIADLFERMHELAFMADVPSGADFVLHVLGELIPCEGIVVHVFDLGKREFVVVRAHGPNARETLLYRTPGDEPMVRSIMSRRRATVLDGAPANVPPVSGSLAKLGIVPKAVLCGAVRLGGRYLGLVELANPQGGQPFHDGETNALDYVCEQFAEFVASRPIVLDADVIIGP